MSKDADRVTTAEAAFLPALAHWGSARELNLPEVALRQARLSVIDTLACMLAGATDPATQKAIHAMRAAGTAGPARPVVGGEPLSLPAAALVNGVAAHVLDFDDYEVPGSTHPSAAILGALFALAEVRDVTLLRLLEAYVVGYEAIVRIGEALGYGHYMAGWHSTSTIGPLGSAAACARLAGLPADAFVCAVSLAASMSAGLKVQFGTHAKPMHAGLAARGGLEAVLLAQAGITATVCPLEGPYGFVQLYGARTSPGLELPRSKLGRVLGIIEHGILRKPWASCAYTHRGIEAAEAIAARPGFKPGELVRGWLRIPEPFARVCAFTDPQSPAEARFSGVYCIAATLVGGRLRPEGFSEAALRRPDVRALMSRLVLDAYDPGPGLEDMSPSAPDTLTVELTGGRTEQASVADVKGGIARPMTEREILDKFCDCGGTLDAAAAILEGAGEAPFRISALLPQ